MGQKSCKAISLYSVHLDVPIVGHYADKVRLEIVLDDRLVEDEHAGFDDKLRRRFNKATLRTVKSACVHKHRPCTHGLLLILRGGEDAILYSARRALRQRFRTRTSKCVGCKTTCHGGVLQ